MIHPARLGRLLSTRLDKLRRVSHKTAEVSLHLRSRILPMAFGAFLVWLLILPGPFPVSGAAFTGSLLLIGYAWARAIAALVTTRRVLRFTALQVGDHLEEILYLENRSAWPVVFAEFIDHSTLPGYVIDGVRVGAARATEQWRLHTICRQRGVFSLGNWDVILGDPFGLFEARQLYRHPEEITIYPSLAKLPPGITHHRTLGDHLVLRQALPAETASAMTARPYVAGDPLRRIHWRTTARHDELFVKAFEPEATSAMWLVLDLDEAVHMGEGPEVIFGEDDHGSRHARLISAQAACGRRSGVRGRGNAGRAAADEPRRPVDDPARVGADRAGPDSIGHRPGSGGFGRHGSRIRWRS